MPLPLGRLTDEPSGRSSETAHVTDLSAVSVSSLRAATSESFAGLDEMSDGGVPVNVTDAVGTTGEPFSFALTRAVPTVVGAVRNAV